MYAKKIDIVHCKIFITKRKGKIHKHGPSLASLNLVILASLFYHLLRVHDDPRNKQLDTRTLQLVYLKNF